jgi:hypothetical protein
LHAEARRLHAAHPDATHVTIRPDASISMLVITEVMTQFRSPDR